MKRKRDNRCRHCKGILIRHGKSTTIQRFICKSCGKTQQLYYRIKRKGEIDTGMLLKLHNEGLRISGIARILERVKSTVQRKISHVRLCT